MSYSGEWIFSQRTNLRRDSITASEVLRKSLTPNMSIGSMTRYVVVLPSHSHDSPCRVDLTTISSSDTETEDTTSTSEGVRPSMQRKNHSQMNSNGKFERMVVQTPTDEQKLNAIKQNVQRRPQYTPAAQSAPRRTRELLTSFNKPPSASSDDVDSLFDHSVNPADRPSRSSSIVVPNGFNRGTSASFQKSSADSLSTLQSEVQIDPLDTHVRNQYAVDCASVTSSEWGADDGKSERDGPTFQRRDASSKRKFKRRWTSDSRDIE